MLALRRGPTSLEFAISQPNDEQMLARPNSWPLAPVLPMRRPTDSGQELGFFLNTDSGIRFYLGVHFRPLDAKVTTMAPAEVLAAAWVVD